MIRTDTLTITSSMLLAIAEIEAFRGAWQALGSLAPERLSALRRVATIESIGSSTRIEGSRLSDLDVERLLSNLDIRTFETRDEQEVAGYAEVMKTVFDAWREIAVTENHIRQLHRDLLRHSTKDERHRGSYKTLSNSIAAFDEAGSQLGVVFETASPFDTPRLMGELISWFDAVTETKELHPLLAIGVFTIVFRDSPVPGRQRAAEPGADDAAASAGGLRLCAVLLAGERHRAEQGGVLSGTPTNAGDHPDRRAGLGAVA